MSAGKTDVKIGHPREQKTQDMIGAPVMSLWTLGFKQRYLELSYKKYNNTRARWHDQQAAGVYLAMVASGTVMYFVMFIFLPQQQHKQYYKEANTCMNLILFSWMGPMLHLAVLALLPEHHYCKHRTHITLALRAFYLYGTAVNGYSQCHVGRAGTHAVDGSALESLFSASAWRGGIVGLLWYAAAFPLLFWQHCLAQSIFLGMYWIKLAPAVCADIAHIQLGNAAAEATARFAQLLWSQMLAAAAAPGTIAAALNVAVRGNPGGNLFGVQTAAEPLAAATVDGTAVLTESTTVKIAVGQVSCLRELRWFEFAVGYALPTFVLYCLEMRSRMHWWQRVHGMQTRHMQCLVQQQQQCTSNSGRSSDSSHGSDSNSGNGLQSTAAAAAAAEFIDGGGSSRVCVICGLPSRHENTATAAMAAAAGDTATDLQQQQSSSKAAEDDCSTPAAAAAMLRAPEAADGRHASIGNDDTLLNLNASFSRQPGSQQQQQQHACNTGSTGRPAAAAPMQQASKTADGSQDANNSPSAGSGQLSRQQQHAQQQPQPTGAGAYCSCSGGVLCFDAFEVECQNAALPPTFKEVYVLLVALALAYVGLGQFKM